MTFRCNGTLDQLKTCQETCEERLANSQFRPKAQASIKNKNFKRKIHQEPVNQISDRKQVNDRKQTQNLKKKADDSLRPTEFKRPKRDEPTNTEHVEIRDESKDDVTIFVSNLDFR